MNKATNAENERKVSSEDAKNWATVLAIVIGGLWALMEFYVLGPQRNTENQTASAQLIPRVNTAISTQIRTDSSTVAEWRSSCDARPEKEATLHLDTRLSLAVESPMKVPVTVRVQDVVVRRFGLFGASQSNTPAPSSPVSGLEGPQAFDVHWSDFVAASSDRQLDPGEFIQFYYAAYLPFRFSCDEKATVGQEEFAIGFRFLLETREGSLDSSAPHATMTVCQIDLQTETNCLVGSDNTPVGLARGINAQWSDGGLIYSPPLR
ncbi:hypothetical protein ACUXV3_17585 [Roseobacteraceae bacterium NS-SX3]